VEGDVEITKRGRGGGGGEEGMRGVEDEGTWG